MPHSNMDIAKQIVCPLCMDTVDKLLYRFHIDSERSILEKIKTEHPAWTATNGLCSRCMDYYQTEIVREQRILPEIGPFFPVRSADDFIILPTGLRVDADPRYTGKGVTICFVDSGFYLHPDLVTDKNRIKCMKDMTGEFDPTDDQQSGQWHGTMSSVVCAGNGYLSRGLYKGIASDASLVLLRVQGKDGKINTGNIIKALEWILENHKEHDIKVLNLSLGSDETGSYKESLVDQLAERLMEAGISIVAAVGNDPSAEIYPPANAPHVIAVGGLDDDNLIGFENYKAYHSAYGKTVDEFMKPELVAHAIWLAAPILPDTEDQEEAAVLYKLLDAPDEDFQKVLERVISKTGLDISILDEKELSYKKKQILERIQQAKYISPHYMHVDGTSFAAPIVTAVVAQLLEIQPDLTPLQIRQILFSSAKRVSGIAAERQGFGRIHPRKSTLKVLRKEYIGQPTDSPLINPHKKTIEFYIRHGSAEQISLAGSFNRWAEDILLMEPAENGLWKIEIPLLPEGTYHYKFLVDSSFWVEDINNPFREPDGFTGFNSILKVKLDKKQLNDDF